MAGRILASRWVGRACALGAFALWTSTAAAEAAAKGGAATVSAACPETLNFTFRRLQDEAPRNLCQYAGKVVLVVNTASYCGFTSQYEGLEALYAKYRERGLVILGFPSNDFSQEPDANRKIADFCFNTYGVKFPMFVKSSVSGEQANPLYATLARLTGKSPRWNFYKYLLDRQGRPVEVWTSVTTPTDSKVRQRIEALLASQPG
jgi:glutathione peroxidase